MAKTNSEPTEPTNTGQTENERPPTYQDANVPGLSAKPTTHRFVRHGRLHPKILVVCNDVERFSFRLDHSNSNAFTIHPGASTDSPPLARLTFSSSHNSFRIAFGDASGLSAVEVRAKIGYPHPKTFEFSSPPSIDEHRGGEWKHRSGWLRNKIMVDASQNLPVVYELYRGQRHLHCATMTIRGKSVVKSSISWHIEPASELEQAFVLLSAIGVAVKLAKGVQASRSEAREFFGLSFGGVFFGSG